MGVPVGKPDGCAGHTGQATDQSVEAYEVTNQEVQGVLSPLT
jgi:hypothetical protein